MSSTYSDRSSFTVPATSSPESPEISDSSALPRLLRNSGKRALTLAAWTPKL